MSIYFDTSYLARLYCEGVGYTAVRDLAGNHVVHRSKFAQIEMVAALHRKFRNGK
ncbi:MAG: hypothetical protein SGI98_09775 [Verrucomicrobiota bacterium]|nr:hypothetical protein [Verrucomicrobiota bacterium]